MDQIGKVPEIKRATRSTETRETETRRKPWAPPSRLDAPPAPPGYKHRWIRAEVGGHQDRNNVAGKLREGYELVRPMNILTLSPLRVTMANMPALSALEVCC
jgi:hypothetical protein